MTEFNTDQLRPFRPFARYNHGMDALVYRSTPGTCVAQRVDQFVTVLWDVDRTDLVGVKFKGFRYIFNTLRSQHGWTTDFLPLAKVLEALMAKVGDDILEEQRELYVRAKKCVERVHLTEKDLKDVAA